MRLFPKILSIILALFVLSILFVPPVKAGCYFNSYNQCTGTCSCPCGGSCKCQLDGWGNCTDSGCNSCPQPTATPKHAAPKETPKPTIIPNTTINPYETACGGGKCTNGYYCCQNPDGSAACCPVGPPPPNGGGNNSNPYLIVQLLDQNFNIITPPGRFYCPPTPTPSPYRSPTPTPTPGCYYKGPIYICPSGNLNPTSEPSFHPQNLCFYQTISLCKVLCDQNQTGYRNHCVAVDCKQNASYLNSQSVPADYGGGISDSYNLLTILGVTPIENLKVAEGNDLPTCYDATNLKNCYTWSQALSSGYRLLNYIVITNTPVPTATPFPTPNHNWLKLKNTSFYTSRPLAQTLPASPVAFDADDDGTAYFIISSSGSNPSASVAQVSDLRGQVGDLSHSPAANV